MMTSTCILNHTITTRIPLRERRWWNKHSHPEVESVTYTDEGDVLSVRLVGAR